MKNPKHCPNSVWNNGRVSSAVKTDATAAVSVSSSAKLADNSFGAAVERGGGELNEKKKEASPFFLFPAYICVKRHFAKFLATVILDEYDLLSLKNCL